MLMAVSAFRRLLRDRGDRDRGLLAAMQGGMVAYLLHLTVDWDWDLAATTVAFLLIVGAAAAYLCGRGLEAAAAPMSGPDPGAADDGPDPGERRGDRTRRSGSARGSSPRFGPAGRALATGIVGLAAVSWLMPYLADRAYSRAITYASENRVADATAQARRASELNPLAADPLITLALLQQQVGKGREAVETMREAVHLQPQNYRVYYQLGLLQLNVLGLKREAARSFRMALELNPYDELSLYELQQAEAR